MKHQNVGFVFPVINREIYVAQRNTPPHKGLYGPVGGKSGLFNPQDQPMLKENPGGSFSARVHDQLAEKLGFEYGSVTAIREFFEEVFQSGPGQAADVAYLGGIFDFFKDKPQNCQFYLATFFSDNFKLNPRELSDIQPLEKITSAQLFPLAKVGLIGLKYLIEVMDSLTIPAYQSLGLERQVPLIDHDEIREILKDKETSIIGAIMAKYSKY